MKFVCCDEIWLYMKDIFGFYVVICFLEFVEEILLEVVKIVVYYSKVKEFSFVFVDFIKICYVKKLSGVKFGFVMYDN